MGTRPAPQALSWARRSGIAAALGITIGVAGLFVAGSVTLPTEPVAVQSFSIPVTTTPCPTKVVDQRTPHDSGGGATIIRTTWERCPGKPPRVIRVEVIEER
jgi:hypothetical protein